MKPYQISVYVRSIRINYKVNNFRYVTVINGIHFETDANKNMYKILGSSIKCIGLAETKTQFIQLIIKNIKP